MIADLGGLHIVPTRITGTGRIRPIHRKKVLRKPKDLIARYPGHVVAFDTFEEHINGTRRHVITFEDLFTRFGFAFATNSHASKAAEEFFEYCREVFPFPITFVLTDNGSEFKKHFSSRVEELHLVHYHTRPKTPKQNAHRERFNRTIQEEFANHHWRTLWLDIPEFNRQLFEWLSWYNTKRVHFAFQNKLSPVQFMLTLPPVLRAIAKGVQRWVASCKGLIVLKMSLIIVFERCLKIFFTTSPIMILVLLCTLWKGDHDAKSCDRTCSYYL
ncbi:MAG: transposase [Candidatus Moranbacteria bacterium]|nr:transposase [Candidatus Moranbacteria bacterium]